MVRQVQNSTDISTAQFFEHYSRLTKAYEKEGVSLQDRMIPLALPSLLFRIFF